MILGIDLGTSAIKVAVLDLSTGRCVASASSPELTIDSPRNGWAEQDPERWWSATLSALGNIPAEIRAQIQAVGISYQMHGLVLIDRHGNPVRPSIIWCDGRATEIGASLAAEGFPSEQTLNEPGNFTLSKLCWVARNEPECLARAAVAFLPGDYLAYKLTGHAATTSTGLSEMMAWDFAARNPCSDAWSRTGAPENLRPELVPIFGDQGRVDPEAASRTGLPVGIPVSYRAGDQPNNALALNVFDPGELAAVAGTSGVLYGIAEQPRRDPIERVNTFLHVSDTPDRQRLGVLLCINGAGAFYSWIRRLFDAPFEQLNALASQSSPGANGVVAIPYGNGPERSLGNRSPGASLQNLDLNRHSRADIARAAMEGIAFAMRYGAEAFRDLGMQTRVIRAGEGSMFQSQLFCQIFASVMQADLQILETDGAHGAARAAGVGAGVFKDLSEAFASLKTLASISPMDDYRDAYAVWLGTCKLHSSRVSRKVTRLRPTPYL